MPSCWHISEAKFNGHLWSCPKTIHFMSMNGHFSAMVNCQRVCGVAAPHLKVAKSSRLGSCQFQHLSSAPSFPNMGNLLWGQRVTKWSDPQDLQVKFNVVKVRCIPFLMNCSWSHGEPNKKWKSLLGSSSQDGNAKTHQKTMIEIVNEIWLPGLSLHETRSATLAVLLAAGG